MGSGMIKGKGKGKKGSGKGKGGFHEFQDASGWDFWGQSGDWWNQAGTSGTGGFYSFGSTQSQQQQASADSSWMRRLCPFTEAVDTDISTPIHTSCTTLSPTSSCFSPVCLSSTLPTSTLTSPSSTLSPTTSCFSPISSPTMSCPYSSISIPSPSSLRVDSEGFNEAVKWTFVSGKGKPGQTKIGKIRQKRTLDVHMNGFECLQEDKEEERKEKEEEEETCRT